MGLKGTEDDGSAMGSGGDVALDRCGGPLGPGLECLGVSMDISGGPK